MGKGIGIFGVDIGTESLRTVLMDPQGTLLAMATHSHSTASPIMGHFEQDPADWRAGLRETVQSCLMQAGYAPENIVAMGFTGTSCTPVPLDKNGKPLRPAIMWMDTRANKEAQEITASHHPALVCDCNLVSAEWMLPKALWLKRHEPGVWDRADKLMEGFDYLVYVLSGRYVTSTGVAVCKRHWSRATGGWPADLFEKIGLPEFVEKNAREIVFPFETAAVMSETGAQELGLRRGTVLANCGGDGYSAMAGMNALTPKRLGLIIGSSTVHLLPTDQPARVPGMWGPWCDVLMPDQWLIEGGQLATGSILRWFVEQFAPDARNEAEQRGLSTYQWLDGKAAAIPPGSDGLVLLDYWRGNRTPYNDTSATGAIWGFTLNHTREHVFRAILEGTAYGAAQNLSHLRASGLSPELIVASGGGAKSRLWLQIHANACGLPVQVPHLIFASAVGAAVNASVAAGLYKNVSEAAERMVKLEPPMDPDLQTHDFYQECLGHYVGTYEALRDHMKAIAFARTRTPLLKPNESRRA